MARAKVEVLITHRDAREIAHKIEAFAKQVMDELEYQKDERMDVTYSDVFRHPPASRRNNAKTGH